VAENPEFKKMMTLVQPNLKLPGRQAVGGRILTAVYEEEWAKFTASLEGKLVTMAVDGWSNLTSHPFLSIMVDDQLFATIDTTGLPDILAVRTQTNRTASHRRVPLGSMQRSPDSDRGANQGNCRRLNHRPLRSLFYCPIDLGIVTDNTSNMSYMRCRINIGEANNDIFQWGCQAHVLNLLAKVFS
jgi:hypothetical protein